MLVDHLDVEIDIIADQRTAADEVQEGGERMIQAPPLGDVGFAQPMHLDSGRVHPGPGSHDRAEGLARQYSVATNFHRRDSDNIVAAGIEARRLAIDRNDLVWR